MPLTRWREGLMAAVYRGELQPCTREDRREAFAHP